MLPSIRGSAMHNDQASAFPARPQADTGAAFAETRSRRGVIARLARNRIALAGAILIGIFILLAILGPLLSPYDATTPVLGERLQAPSLAHPCGTDDVGRDLLTRIAYGAQLSLLMGVAAMAVACAIGVPVGMLAGYRGGWYDLGLMRTVDVLLTIPSVVLAIAIVSALGAGVTSVILAVGVTSIPAFARLTRAVVLTLREQEFVQAARVSGAADLRIFRLHLLPNVLPSLIVQISLGIGTTILIASALGFLGLGVRPPTPEWGVMLSRGRTYVSSAPHLVIFPGLAIALLVLAFNLLGDGLVDTLDPRSAEGGH